MLTPDRIAAVKMMNSTDAYYQQILAELQGYADKTITQPYTNNSTSAAFSTVRLNICATAGMYAVTNDSKYLNWTIGELMSLSNLSDWDPSSFLETGDVAQSVAMAYDWVYHELTAAQRLTIENALVTKAMQAAINSATNGNFWANHTNNWAMVCHGPLLLAAAAIGDINPDMANAIVNFSLPKLLVCLEQFAPDGGWIEGYNYGIYATTFLGLAMSGLNSSLGHDWGISASAGVDQHGSFLLNFLAQDGYAFGFGDGSTKVGPSGLWQAGYLEKFYGKQSEGWLAGILSKFVSSLGQFQALLWYETDLAQNSTVPCLPLSAEWENIQATTFRTSWTDPNAWFVGFRGGFNGRSHGFLDIGAFYIQAKGEVWATTLGSGNYSLPGYFSKGNERWTYYNPSTQGANTLTISRQNQTALHFENQVPSANCSLLTTGDLSNNGHFAIANLTDAYNSTTRVFRGVALVNSTNGTQVIIQDEVKSAQPVNIITNWHTAANVTIESTGQQATLTMGNETMMVNLQSPDGAYFQTFSTNPCQNVTGFCSQSTNEGISNLVVRLPKMVTNATVTVSLSETGTMSPDFINRPLASWASLCTGNCVSGMETDDPYWLRDAETYYPSEVKLYLP